MSTTPKKLVREQVVYVKIAGSARNVRFSEGEHLLQEHGFTGIKAEEKPSQNIFGIAPAAGPDSFVLIEYAECERVANTPFTVYWINRGTKTVLDTGRIQFTLGAYDYTCAGDSIPVWEIKTTPPAPDVLERASLFKEGKLTIKDEEFMASARLPLMEGANTLSLAGRVEPIMRIKERNPLFVQFVHDYGNNDFSVTAVARTVAAYIASKEGMTVSGFAKKFKEGNEGIFQQLIAVNKLHTELMPLLDTTVVEEKEGKERISLNVAAHIAKLPLSLQVRAWNTIKTLPTHDKRFTAIKKIRKTVDDTGTF